jgi:hypothetical protein
MALQQLSFNFQTKQNTKQNRENNNYRSINLESIKNSNYNLTAEKHIKHTNLTKEHHKLKTEIEEQIKKLKKLTEEERNYSNLILEILNKITLENTRN